MGDLWLEVHNVDIWFKYVLFSLFYDAANLVQLRADILRIKEKSPLFLHNHDVYSLHYSIWSRKEALVRKRGLYQPSLCCFNTADLGALLTAKLQSPTEQCAYFLCPLLDHMEHKGHRDTVYHRFVAVCYIVRICACVYVSPVCKLSQICQCLWIWQQGALILSAFAFSRQPRTLLLALPI